MFRRRSPVSCTLLEVNDVTSGMRCDRAFTRREVFVHTAPCLGVYMKEYWHIGTLRPVFNERQLLLF